MMPGNPSRSWVSTNLGGAEDVLPTPLASRVRKLPAKRLRKVSLPDASGQIFLVSLVGARQVLSQAGFQSLRQRNNAVFAAFSIVDYDDSTVEIEVFDPQTKTFHQPHAAAVKQFRDQFPRLGQVRENPLDLIPRQDSRRTSRTRAGGNQLELKFLYAKHLPRQEHQGVESLLLSAGGNPALERKVFQIGRMAQG